MSLPPTIQDLTQCQWSEGQLKVGVRRREVYDYPYSNVGFNCRFLHRNLSDSKSAQMSWTLLSNLAKFNTAVVGMVSSFPLISSFPILFSCHVAIVPYSPTMTDFTDNSTYPHSGKIHLFFHSLWVFLTILSWWSFAGDWVTVSLPRSPGLFSVFWRIPKKLYCFNSSSDFQLFLPFGDRSKRASYKWYNRLPHLPRFS